MKRKLLTWVIALMLLPVAGALSAAPKQKPVYDNTELRVRFEWPTPGSIRVVRGDHDIALEGSVGGIDVKLVVRPGESIPESQHQFRLMSYFAGAWEKDDAECRGTGWNGCASWHFASESGKTKGVAEVGFGPGGTYMLVLTSSAGSFQERRPKMRALEQSVVLY